MIKISLKKQVWTIIDSNKFNYKNKIGEFKYIDIKDLVNNIRNNTISEIDARKDLNTLDKIKNTEIIKYKKRTPAHKFIQWLIRYNFNWQNIRIRKWRRWKWKQKLKSRKQKWK